MVNKTSVIELTSREINRYLKKHEKRKCICDERWKLFKGDKCMMRPRGVPWREKAEQFRTAASSRIFVEERSMQQEGLLEQEMMWGGGEFPELRMGTSKGKIASRGRSLDVLGL